MSDYLNRVLDWLDANADEKKIERWFFFITHQDIIKVAPDGFMGIIFFDGPEQGAPLTCLGEAYRARSLGSQRMACTRDGEAIPAGIP